MKTVAVIIKHPGRDFDYRVDLYEVPDESTEPEIKRFVDSQMLGPFEVIAITDRISKVRKLESKSVTILVNSLESK